MTIFPKTLSCSGIFSSSESVQFRSSICASDEFTKYSACTSLQFAEYLINMSKERLSNPVHCLQLLSCGAETLKKQFLTSSAIAFCLLLPSLLYLQDLSSERPKKKRPEENELITSNSLNGSDANDGMCFDGEGDTKAKEREGNQQKSDTNSSHSSPSTVGACGGKNEIQSSCNGNSDEDEDDDDENWHKRKLATAPFSGPFIKSNEDDDDAEDDNAVNVKKDIDDNNAAKDCMGSGCDNENTGTDELAGDIVDYDCNADYDYANTENNDNNKVENADEFYDDGSLYEGDIDDVKAENSDIDDVVGSHSEHDDDGSEEFEVENVNNVDSGCSINPQYPHEGDNYAYRAKIVSDQEQILKSASICNMESGSIIEELRENPCYHMQVLLEHIQKCKYRVLGGCEQCHCIPTVLNIYHASQCEKERCAIPKYRLTNEHFKDEPQANILGHQRHNNDRVFFGEYFDTSSHNKAERDDVSIGHQENDELLHRSNEISSISGNSAGSLVTNSSGFSRSTVSRGVHRQTENLSPELLGLQRPARVNLLYPLKEHYLGMQEGRYDEGFEWRKVAYLGQGSFGKCYLNLDLKTNKHFATKKIPLSKYDQSELMIWSAINGNVNILELLGALQVDKSVIFFMEYMEERSLAYLLVYQEKGCLNEECSLYILREVLEGVNFLHSKNIIHCDIKGENVFVNSVLTKVKLGDFGSANQLHSSGWYTQKNNMLKATVNFMAPEACRGERISFSVDIWSCACLMVQMLTGKPPFHDFIGSVLYKVGKLKEPPLLPPACSEVVADMLKDMFAVNPCERPSAVKLISQYKALSED